MVDNNDLYSAVIRVFADPIHSTIEDLSKACRFCATDEQSTEAIEKHENLSESFYGLIEISLEGRSESDERFVKLRRARLALRTLINAINRSHRLRDSITVETLSLWRVLLRISELHTEVFAALAAVARPMHRACALSPDYPLLLGEIFILWETVSDSDRSWLSTIIAIHLEEDYAFLANSFADVSPEQFVALLHATETLMDYAETGVISKVHSNNIQFCVDLIGRILFDINYEVLDRTKQLAYIEQMMFVIEILASAALRMEQFGNEVQKSGTMEALIDILEEVLDSQCTNSGEKTEGKKSTVFSEVLRESSMELRASLKCAAVRCIGNFCCYSEKNRAAAAQRGGVIVVLRCTKREETDKPFIVQWSIAALRHLCLGCPENQKILLSIEQKPTGILDRERLLKELGIEVELNKETGTIQLKKAKIDRLDYLT